MSILFQNVVKTFGDRTVLNQVSFCAKKGELLFILGKSGVGKSVTLKTIVGLLRPDSGEVLIEGQCVNDYTSDEDLKPLRRKCGMIFQHPALLDSLTVYENICFGLKHQTSANQEKEGSNKKASPFISADKLRSIATFRLKQVHLNANILDRYPQELSVGMQKRVSIARALALEPQYLLFDEPTTGFDPVTSRSIHELIFELSRNTGVTSLVVSHDMESAIKYADHLVVLDEGKVVFDGKQDALQNSEHPLIVEFLNSFK